MSSSESSSFEPVGNIALAMAVGSPQQMLRQITYVGNTREREIIRVEDGIRKIERQLPQSYLPSETGLLGHVIFALKHEIPVLGLLAAVFRIMPVEEIVTYIKSSPTGAYARRIGFLYELLTNRELGASLDNVRIGGNYVELLDSTKLVTAKLVRNSRWRILDNLPGTRAYAPLIERTEEVEQMLSHDWQRDVSDALAMGRDHDTLLHRAMGYLYLKETRSSFAIERENPSEARAARFVDTLKQAGKGAAAAALSEKSLSEIQNLIVDTRFAEPGFRRIQNYVAATVRWKTVVHFVPPPPKMLSELMSGLAETVRRLDGTAPLAQAAVASFGLVFHHPFEDGNGRLHRYLLHDFLARNRIIPNGMALPVSAAILDDMGGYDLALEAFSGIVGKLVAYRMNDHDEMTITNVGEIDWVWRYPDLTAQMEYLGRVLKRAVKMVAEEVTYLMRYDTLLKRIRALVDMPDRRLTDLLTQIHNNHGRLSNNKRKQRFPELSDKEITEIESAYVEIFMASDNAI